MKRTLIAVVAIAGVGAALAATQAPRIATMLAGGSWCATAPTAQTADAGAPTPKGKSADLLMSMVCERACAAKGDHDPARIVRQPGAQPGDLTRCPVSGVVFVVHPDGPGHAVSGHTFHTCCGTCVAKLRKDPGRFLTL